MGPFTAILGDGHVLSCSLMINGRPADSHYFTEFFVPGAKRNLESKETFTQVGGMQWCSAQLQGGRWHGHGKVSLTNGRVFIGEFK